MAFPTLHWKVKDARDFWMSRRKTKNLEKRLAKLKAEKKAKQANARRKPRKVGKSDESAQVKGK